MAEANHQKALEKIFSTLEGETLKLGAREGKSIEFKEAFDWGNKDRYAKTLAAFANCRGGYIVFGVTDAPRHLKGLSGTRFESFDEATLAAYLNGAFAPELLFEKHSYKIAGKTVGVLYVPSHAAKPIIAIKNDGQIREGEIYFRYSGRSEKIKFPELRAILDHVRDQERANWMDLFRRVSQIGPGNAGIMDVVQGAVEGIGGSLLIDATLIPKLKFIREGSFAERGAPTLKLIGDVQPVAMAGGKERPRAVRITNDPNAPVVREESILGAYPLTYDELVKRLRRRFSNFKVTNQFHRLRKNLMKNEHYCRTRHLDPKKPSGIKKDYYSEEMLAAFDPHYTKRP